MLLHLIMCLKAFLGLLSSRDKLELLNCVTHRSLHFVHLKQIKFWSGIISHEA